LTRDPRNGIRRFPTSTQSTHTGRGRRARRSSRNVKRWQSREGRFAWTAAGVLEAEQQFRRVIG